MALNGVVRLPAGHLDPTAQEFRPTYPAHEFPFPFFAPPQLQPPPPHHTFFPDMIFSPPPPLPPPQQQIPPQPTYLPPAIPPAASAPTRALLLSAVPPEVSESCVRRELEVFGDVRAVQMERVREGIVTVHFYDLRAACAAIDAIRDQHMQHQHRLRLHFSSFMARNHNYPMSPGFDAPPPPPPPPAHGLISGRAVWAHFTIPATHAFPDGHNQGTIVIFNLDPNVSAPTLKNIFKIYGAVKELRETPMKRQQRFVEFYDVRDAAKALSEMNGREINGRSVMIEYSRPGGYIHKKFLNYRSSNNNNNNPSRHYHHHRPQHQQQHQVNNNNKPLSLPPSPPPPPTPPPPPQTRILPYRSRKPVQVARRRSSPSSEESVEAAMNRLTLRPRSVGNNTTTNNNNGINNNRKGSGSGNCSSPGSGSSGTTTTTKQQQQKVVSRAWKGGRQKNYDPRYLIKEESIIISSGGVQDIRTTVMIKNIPNKYSQKLLLNMLDNHCIHCNEQISSGGDDQPLSSYDFVYLPIDFNNKCNVGYGFVNMTSPEATLRLYKAFHHQHWEVFNSRKICEVTYARVQGLEALKEHFKNSKFACENEEYLPVVFTPPRNGRHLTTPQPIVFSNATTGSDGGDLTSSTTSTITTTHPNSDFDHDEEDDNDVAINDDDESRSSSDGGGGVINNDDMMDGLQDTAVNVVAAR